MKLILALLLVVITSNCLFAQLDEARDALDKGQNVRAVNILSDLLASRPTADAYLYLGIAYGKMKEYQKSEDTLKEGSQRYPRDSRFHNELADLYLTNNDRDNAKSELRRALVVDPNNNYASDLLATIDMSEGEVQSALRSWNKSGRPVINDILHNYYLTFGSWVVRDAVAFHPTDVLQYSQWKTTEARLFETGNFANAGLEVEPTVVPDEYNAIVRTTAKNNSLANVLFGVFKGVPIKTSYLDFWNIGNSGVNFNNNYRWEENRRRVEAGFKIPVPLAGLLFFEPGDIWRDENWDVSSQLQPQVTQNPNFSYKANAVGARLKAIPHYRVELGAGFQYRNRFATGSLPQLFTNIHKVAKFDAELNLRLFDGDYQNLLQLAGFGARRSVLGDINFSGAVAELDNRINFSRDTRTSLDWVLKAGTSRGSLPLDEYFLLGVDTNPANLLRGHTATEHGRYGHGPMGTDFGLVNVDLERRLATLPLFNNFNIPFLVVKWDLFFDGAKTWDQNHVVEGGKLLLDTGGGVRFETPTHSLNLGYGRSLRDGKNVLFVYYQRRLW